MAGRTNKDKDLKDPELEAVLDETPPDINDPLEPETNEDPIPKDEILSDPDNQEPEEDKDPESLEEDVLEDKPEDKVEPEDKSESKETPEQKEQRFKAQQTEAQIQVERNKALTDKVEEAATVTASEDELRAFVKEDGAEWDELTNFEQGMAKRTYLSEKKFGIVHEAVKTAKQVDEWAGKVDTFIDETDGKPEYVELSGFEADFRKFAMKEAHRGTPIEVLLPAFLHNLPPVKKSRGSLFEKGGGGDKTEKKTGIDDAEVVKKLRESNPKEYKRLLKAGKIKLEV